MCMRQSFRLLLDLKTPWRSGFAAWILRRFRTIPGDLLEILRPLVIVPCDLAGGEVIECPKVILPFSQYRNPAQTSLGSLRDQELEEKPIVVSWHYPFLSWYSNIRGSFHTHCTVLPLILAKMLATIHSILGIRWYKAIKTSPRSRDTGGCCRLWPTPAPGSESGRWSEASAHSSSHIYLFVFKLSRAPELRARFNLDYHDRISSQKISLSSSNLSCECDN